MREYIIAFDGSWLHFFIKPHVGLCSRQKRGFKFDDSKVLLPGACADFCVYSTDGFIHVVCQDERGSVLYLLYDKTTWKKSTLLESRTAKPYTKNFFITEISGHINILYTVENKEKLMLVHQILIGNSTPSVVDYIAPDSVPFCIYKHHETDFSVFYTNEEGIGCEKIYKWSQKQFLEPRMLEEGISVKFADEKNNTTGYAAIKIINDIRSLIYITKNSDDEELQMPVYLDCRKDIAPVISHYGEKQYMVWTEHGNVMSSCLGSDEKWSKPMQYAKSSKSEIKLYAICIEGKYEYYYGIAREHDITLYGTHDILKKSPQKTNFEESYSKKYACNEPESLYQAQEKQIKLLCQELSNQRKKLTELSEKIEELLAIIPLADDEDIDNVLLN